MKHWLLSRECYLSPIFWDANNENLPGAQGLGEAYVRDFVKAGYALA